MKNSTGSGMAIEVC